MELNTNLTHQRTMSYDPAWPNTAQMPATFTTVDKDGNPAWIHVSFISKEKNRRQYLRIGK